MNKNNLEIEHKFLIRYPRTESFKTLPGYREQKLLQIYTRLPDGSNCRIRKIEDFEGIRYIKTVKQDINSLTRIEIEEEISKEDFEALALLRHENRRPIEKVRHSFTLSGFTYEVDIFPFWNDRAFLEIEVESEDIKPPIPSFIEVIKEVTEDLRYRNSALSREIITEEI